MKTTTEKPPEHPANAGCVHPLVLRWRESTHDIYKTQSFFSEQPWIEHSVGPAGYEVFYDSFGWTATWWHGNRGHSLGRKPDAEAMKEVCRRHLLSMLEGILSQNAQSQSPT